VTAEDPAGGWSEPVWLDEEGIDPDLCWDEDGSAYYLRNGPGGIYLGRLDARAGRLEGPMERAWTGSGGQYPEGPHLYRVGGTYYLMIAEGGTGYGHMQTVARAPAPAGPYEPCPHNPILTHRDRPSHPIQCTGHADLVEAHDGSWWAVFLAVRDRHPGQRSFHLGRETCLAPVSWTDDGWPVIGDDGRVEVEMEGPDWEPHPWEAPPARDDFDAPELGPRWNTLRLPLAEYGSLEDRPGWLRLDGTAGTLSDVGPVAFAGCRQREMACHAAALLDFSPRRAGEEAGLAVRMSEDLHYDLGVKMLEGQRRLVVRRCIDGREEFVCRQALPAGPVELRLQADADTYRLAFGPPGGPFQPAASLDVADVANEGDAPFTGVYVGLYATGDGEPSGSPAWFDWFELV
jgi:alpha-N-arabinofuranosidase